MNRKGQEAGQAISTLVVFFIILVLLVVFYWISTTASLFTRGIDASSIESYSGAVGNPDLLFLPKTDDVFLNRPILVQFADGDIQLMPVYVLAALYRNDAHEINEIELKIASEPKQSEKDVLIKERTSAYLHSVNSKIFEDSLKLFLIKQGAQNNCLILGQDVGRDLKSRIESSSNEGNDLFLKKIGDSKVEVFKISSNSAYFSKVSDYAYTSSDGEVMVEYYYGPCLEGNS